MTKRVFIIHGYGGSPKINWFPWLKAELEKLGVVVTVPAMPNADQPKLDEWLPYLQEIAGEPDDELYLVGHSLGCPTILRYLEALPEGKKVGGVVLVAGFTEPLGHLPELDSFVWPPWNDAKIMRSVHKITMISSDNDPHIPYEMAERMRDRFDAKLVTLHNAGHINRKDGYLELPQALEELKELIRP